jgi:bromodomain adjacent to zinc finger domain protein 1A
MQCSSQHPSHPLTALALEKEREAEKLLAKAEAERQAADKKKKKPIRYPTEDLDVTLSEKEKKAGMKVRRPIPSRSALPFNDREGSFESFLMTWNFLVVYG